MIATLPDHVTPSFVTSLLAPSFPGVRVTRCRPEPLVTERGFTTTLVRLHLTVEGAAPPTSLMAKPSPTDPEDRALLQAMRFFEREVHFYRALAAATPVSTATCYLADLDPTSGTALLLLEDLGPHRNGSTAAGGSVDDVAAVLVALARMHARWWQHDKVADAHWADLPSWLAPSAVLDVFERAWPSFLSKVGIPVDDTFLAAKAWISSTLERAATTLFETGPRTLVHNDVQGDNLFFSPDPERPVTFVDWQMVTYGRCVVDVVNVIRGMLEVEARRSAEADLLEHYHSRLVAGGVHGYSFEQCQADYHLASVLAPARLASAVGVLPALQAHPGAVWDRLFPRLVADHHA